MKFSFDTSKLKELFHLSFHESTKKDHTMQKKARIFVQCSVLASIWLLLSSRKGVNDDLFFKDLNCFLRSKDRIEV